MLLLLLTNFQIQKYYQNESRFSDANSRDNLPGRSSTEINKGWFIYSKSR